MSGDGNSVFIGDDEGGIEYPDTRTALGEVSDENNEPDQSFLRSPVVATTFGEMDYEHNGRCASARFNGE